MCAPGSFTLNPYDTMEKIQEATAFWEMGFKSAYPTLPDGQDRLVMLRNALEGNLHETDRKMTTIIDQAGTVHDLTNWAARVRLALEQIDRLDRNIAFKGKRQWSWPEVTSAAALLKALLQGAEVTLLQYVD